MEFVLISLVLLLPHAAQAITVQGDGMVGALCTMGGGVKGRCQEVAACLKERGIVERLGEVHLCAPRGSDIIVCCRKPEVVTEELCAAWAQHWRGPQGFCVEESSLIVGGVDADVGEFPHIAIIGKKINDPFEGSFIKWHCGGTLVSPYFVLTAAHCVSQIVPSTIGVTEKPEFWVRLGEHDREIDRFDEMIPVIKGPIPPSLRYADKLNGFSNTQAPVEQTVLVDQVIRYPEYRIFMYYDIALLRLSEPVNLTKRVLPACLPTHTTDDLVGKELTVAGWGRTDFSTQELTRILQKVSVPVVDLLECQFRNPDYSGRTIPKGVLKDQLCAGRANRDSCKGDSGGPLIDQKERGGSVCEHTVEGVVSFGKGCGDIGVYTRVSSYLDWITGYVAPGYPSAFAG